MLRKTSKRKELVRQVAVYTFMVSIVFVTVSLITLFMLGFRFDADKGNLEQYAFLQYSSTPSGATVSVDGVVIGSKTPNKSSVPAGKHEIVMWRDGYEKWQKTVNVKAGTLTWLNYTLLIPKKLTVEPVSNYDSIFLSLASPKGDDMLIQKRSELPIFELVDLRSDKIKSTSLTFPSSLYSDPTTAGVLHEFTIEKWDDGGRYVLVKHTYGDKYEWLELDTQNVSVSKNISRLFDLNISNVVFSGTSGNILYALDTNDIRKFDLAAATISKPLVSDVTGFDIYNESKVITYVGVGKSGTSERVVGVYREGDDNPSAIRTTTSSSDVPLRIATTFYFNENYVAISEGKKIDILSGSYPNTTSDNSSAMKVVATFETNESVSELTFSPTGEYVFMQSGANYASYDLEYHRLVPSVLEGTAPAPSFQWLDDYCVWSDRDGKLTIREFDGANIHTINSAIPGQDATLTNNGRYLYSLGKTDSGYQLQRVRMILP